MIPCCILAIENDDDRDFMIDLYENYKQLMHSTVRKLVKNEHDIEDLTQDVLVKLIDKIDLLRSRSRDQRVNYIISACKYTAFNHNRKRGSHPELFFETCGELNDPRYDEREIELRLIRGEEMEALQRVLPKMDLRMQCLLEGYYFLEKSTAELGEDLGIKPDSVRMYLTRARKKAFELMQEELEQKK